MGGLVLLSLVLVTISFREDGSGPLASVQNGAAAVLRPFQVAADRVAEPFRDAYGWTSSLLDARSDAARLEKENELLRQQVAERRLAHRENVTLRKLLAYRNGPRFPEGYSGLAAAVISRPAGAYAQAISDRGRAQGRRPHRRPGRHAGRARRQGQPRELADGARHPPHGRRERRLGPRRRDAGVRHRPLR